MPSPDWVAVRRHPQESRSFWIRVDTIERVEIRAGGPRISDWHVAASVRGEHYVIAEPPMTEADARECAQRLMAAVTLERSRVLA